MVEPVSRRPDKSGSAADSFSVAAPKLELPKGGGAIRGIGEKFSANPVTGTAMLPVPIATSPGRGGFGPQLALTYDSGSGASIFGLGWNLALPAISRKTDKGLPRYCDSDESDTFLLSGAEDLVPVLDPVSGKREVELTRLHGKSYSVTLYRPRIEGLFARIERWSETGQPENHFWRSISRDNVTTWYGLDATSRIADPADPTRIFTWLLCRTHDDKGNVAVYEYKSEDSVGVAKQSAYEANRSDKSREANRYIKRILYGNKSPYLPMLDPNGNETPLPAQGDWMFEVVFDYGDHLPDAPTVAHPNPLDVPTRAPRRDWLCRPDPFSTYRGGFEVRNYRLCRRVLMLHHFKHETNIGENCVVRSTDFTYDEPDAQALANAETAGYTQLKAVRHTGWQRKPASQEYLTRSLPPLEFGYSKPVIDATPRTIPPESLENLPVGVQGAGYQWVDLDGEGICGVLTEQAGAWFYKAGLGAATPGAPAQQASSPRFSPTRVVPTKPAMAALAAARQQLMDLAGDGELDLVDFSGPAPGFHERTADDDWKQFIPFVSLPNIDWGDANLRFVDLTGDGHADALITEHEVFTWYPSRGEEGFGPSARTQQSRDDEAGPRLVFADGTQTVFLADMVGDGLTDLVRIRNGEVCYWPNLGYGRFGAKVTFDHSPVFDHPDLYDPRRIRLTDIDGSGPVDVIYLGRDGAQLYFNRSGNQLSDVRRLPFPLALDNATTIQVADLLGTGTACLVWSSALPSDASSPVRYIDLMHEGKPHLLVETRNNFGATTRIEYTPSTQSYVADKLAGKPWITRLPFPVHCVSKVTVEDKWRGTSFSNTYSYHHGYFDGVEREFRGFGRVEQVDCEAYGKFLQGNAASPYITDDMSLYQPPVKTVTWFHTGIAFDRQHVLSQFAHEYFTATHPFAAGFKENVLPEPDLDATELDADEWREAMRACKGMALRQEIYELDVDDLAAATPRHTPVRLYSAAAHNCHIRRVQARGPNRHAVFLVTESEAITYHYELNLRNAVAPLEADPRVAHTLNLRFDDYGAPLQSVAIGYPRFRQYVNAALDVQPLALVNKVQAEMHIAYTEIRLTDDVEMRAAGGGALPAGTQRAVRHYRLRVPCETRSYEITHLVASPASGYFDLATLKHHAFSDYVAYAPTAPAIAVAKLEYHEQPATQTPHKRIVEHARSLYFDDASDTAPPTTALAFGKHGPRGLKYQDYKLALTKTLLSKVFTGTASGGLPADKLDWSVDAAKTAHDLLDDPKVSGYVPGTEIDLGLIDQYWVRSGVAGFALDAHKHFFLPNLYTDPFGNETRLEYDGNYDLYVQAVEDAMQNRVQVEQFDFRALAPTEMLDANGNRTAAALDVLDMVVAMAVKGKKINNKWEADHLDAVTIDWLNPPESDVRDFFTQTLSDQNREVQARTWLGTATARFVYHFGDDSAGNWMVRPAGACGIMRETHVGKLAAGAKSRVQISLECTDGGGSVLMKKVQAEPLTMNGPLRWIVNGLTILNNKGKPVKQYEPDFSTQGFGCEMPQANGKTPVIYYDAAGRAIRTDFPDGTFSRVEFSPWHALTYDQNDTVEDSRWYRERLTAAERGVALLPTHATPREIADANAAEVLGSAAGADEKRAARIAAKHANTPALTLLDSLGREVVTIAHNKSPQQGTALNNTPLLNRNWLDERHITYTKLDAEGKPLWICDARGNLVMQYITPVKATRTPLFDQTNPDFMPAYSLNPRASPCYDIAGNLLFQHSMDAGDRWMLTDAAGKPMLGWDGNDVAGHSGQFEHRLFHTEYDKLHRPTAQWLKIGLNTPAQIEVFEYCDTANLGGLTLTAAKGRNLIGQAVRHWDASGLATVERIDLCGKPAHIKRTLVADVKKAFVAWPLAVANRAALLETETFEQITEFDALGRMTRLFNWHRGVGSRVAVYEPQYNQRGLLASEHLTVRAKKISTGDGYVATANTTHADAIKSITYNAKGQKLALALGNDTTTRYTYDPDTFRLIHLYTRRGPGFAGDCAGDPDAQRPARPCGVQNLHYTYDPVGNITHVQDDAQQTVFFNGQRVDPSNDYIYDAIYRLIEGKGRENGVAQGASPHHEPPWPTGPVPSPDMLRNYTQQYMYDAVGNFLEMRHVANGPPGQPDQWTRYYEPATDSNRLNYTWFGDRVRTNGTGVVACRHDPHGNMLNLAATLPGTDIRWDWRDMISDMNLIGGGWAYYQYGVDKQRTRKHITRNVSAGGTITEDRIYLGGYELYRRRNANSNVAVEEIESLHLFEGEQRVLLVDDVITTDGARPDGLNVPVKTLWRYQYGNHLGSVGLELDDTARVISYEEFHPYGTSAYRLMNSAVEAPPRRYRYTGMERDEESGLNCHGARYYPPWLGRWTSRDPAGIADGINLYKFVRNNPLKSVDTTGTATDTPPQQDPPPPPTPPPPPDPAAFIHDVVGHELPVECVSPEQFAEFNLTAQAVQRVAAQHFPVLAQPPELVLGSEGSVRQGEFVGFAGDNLLPPGQFPVGHTHELGTNVSGNVIDYQNMITHGKTEDLISIGTRLDETGNVIQPSITHLLRDPDTGVITATNYRMSGEVSREYIPGPQNPPDIPGPQNPSAPPSSDADPDFAVNVGVAIGAGPGVDMAINKLVPQEYQGAAKAVASVVVPAAIQTVRQLGVRGTITAVRYVASTTATALTTEVAAGAASTAAVTTAAVVAAVGAVGWAVEDTRRALRGEKTMTDVATETYSKLGFVGTMQAFWWQIAN